MWLHEVRSVGKSEQLPAFTKLNDSRPAKPLLFTSRQNTLILNLCVFIPVLNVPFRTLTLKDPSLRAVTNPAV